METIKNYKPQPYNATKIGIDKVITGLAEVGIISVVPGDIPKLLPPDPFEPALDIMADVRAYFQGNAFLEFIHPLSGSLTVSV
jgi:hypothetical protein